MKNGPKKIGIEDVAKAARVSIATVSRVVNHSSVVKAPTRQRVERIIRELKYHPDPSARRLAGGKTNIFLAALPYFEGLFHSFFAAELLRGIGEGVASRRYDLLLHITRERRAPGFAMCDGAILAGVDQHPYLIQETVRAGIPCVVVNHVSEDPRIACLGIDNRRGAELGVDHLVSLGHRRIGTITGSLNTQAGKARLEGFQAALARHGLEIRNEWILIGDFSPLSACAAIESLLAQSERPTALVIASDEMAIAAIEALAGHGVRVPEEMSIVGYDDTPAADLFRVPLTTIAQPLRQLGFEAVQLLYQLVYERRQLEGERLLPVELVVRQSTTAPPKPTRGFTLIEIMLVVLIIGMLAAAVVPRLVGRSEEARRARAESDIASISVSLDLYELDYGEYPRDLSELLTKKDKGPYLKKLPKDPWGHTYHYQYPGTYNQDDYDLASWGKDGNEGGEGPSADVTNWGDEHEER